MSRMLGTVPSSNVSRSTMRACGLQAGKPRTQQHRAQRVQATTDAGLAASTHTWKWKNHNINYVVAGSGKPIVLVHGFGASVGHWRYNIPELAKDYKVYAIDLLGFGASEKAKLVYSIELWRDLLLDFTTEFVDEPFVMVGNSVGSLVCLAANAASEPGRVRGTVLLNCAGGMNNKARSDDWRIQLAMPIFRLVDIILQTKSLAVPAFERFRQPENIRQVLENVYVNKAAVDDELVDIICRPSDDAGALDVFVSVFTGNPGPRPELLIPEIDNPLLVLWGDTDLLTPLNGPVGQYFENLPTTRPQTTMQVLADVGHCPHDDKPDLVHGPLLAWLKTL